MDRLTDVMPPEAEPGDPLRTTTIMTYELGGMIKSLVYADHKKRQGQEKSYRARMADARIGLADLITQCHVLAEQLGWKMIDLRNDGMERFEERMREIEEGTL